MKNLSGLFKRCKTKLMSALGKSKGLSRLSALSAIVFLIAVSFISTVAIGHIHYGVSTTSTSTTKYNKAWVFYVVVNYTQDWNVTYQGYAHGNIPTNNGNYSGSGFEIRRVSVNATLSQGLSLCASAEKQDNSNNTLSLSIYPDNPAFGGANYNASTSEPFGIANTCFEMLP
ncbi:MAG: hypothetical protein ACYCQJ_06100 [Nitrososphaerales archaeon]